jgi:hypothetical protein
MYDYDEQIDNAYDRLNNIHDQANQPFESEQAIAQHIFSHEPSPAKAVNSDSPRANLAPQELRTARVLGNLIAVIEAAEKTCGWDLSIAKSEMIDYLSTTNVPSRSKHGYAIYMAKTSKNIQSQEVQGMADRVSNDFDEKTEESLLSKIPLLGGFLKKKQDGANNG